MFASFLQIDPWGVLAALASFFVLGGIWYPLIVGRAYETALGKPRKTDVLHLVGPLACLGVITLANAWLVQALAVDGVPQAALVGLIVGIGYLLPMTLNISLNPLFPRPFLYTAINAPFFIVGCAINCVVLSVI